MARTLRGTRQQREWHLGLTREAAALAEATGAQVTAGSDGAVVYSFRSGDGGQHEAGGGIAGILRPQPTAFDLARRQLGAALPAEAAAGLRRQLRRMPGGAGSIDAVLASVRDATTSTATGLMQRSRPVRQAVAAEVREATKLAQQAAGLAADFDRLLSLAGPAPASQRAQRPRQQQPPPRGAAPEIAAAAEEASLLAQRAARLAEMERLLQEEGRQLQRQRRLLRPGRRAPAAGTVASTTASLAPAPERAAAAAAAPSPSSSSAPALPPAPEVGVGRGQPAAGALPGLLQRWSHISEVGAPNVTCITSRPSLPAAAAWVLCEQVVAMARSLGAACLPPAAQAPAALAVSLAMLAAATAPLW